MTTVTPTHDDRKGSFRFDLTEPTILEVDAAEKLRDYKIVWFNSNHKVKKGRIDGEKYRFTHWIVIRDDVEEIRIYLQRGATTFDVKAATWNVESILDGYLHQFPWRHLTRERDGMKYREVLLGTRSQASKDAALTDWRYNGGMRSCEVEACRDYRKPELLASDNNGNLVAEHHGEQIARPDHYSLELTKDGDEPWNLFLDLRDEYLDPFTAKSLVNDLLWMTAEVEKLNKPGAVAA